MSGDFARGRMGDGVMGRITNYDLSEEFGATT